MPYHDPKVPAPAGKHTVDFTIPVLNEAHVLVQTVETVRTYLLEQFPYPWRIVIVDNGSTDGTGKIAERLAESYDDVHSTFLKDTGRGRALRTAWMQSEADIFCYFDVDLSTDIVLVVPLVEAVIRDGYDLSIGSRLMKGAQIRRSLIREVVSRSYNLLVKAVLQTGFSDAQCGFKAISKSAAQSLLPQVQNQSWFFDTEMLVLAEKQGYKIKEIPVRWIEDPDSRVKLIRTSWENMKAVAGLRWRLWKMQRAGLLLQPARTTTKRSA